jgi:hypothetical protein
MKHRFNLIAGIGLFLLVGWIGWSHRHQVMATPLVQPPTVQTESGSGEEEYAEARQARQAVTIAGPLADYVKDEETSKARDREKASEVRTYQPTAFDHVGGSPVGSSSPIVHKTFPVSAVVDVPFQVPAHAATPQLRGAYRSFRKEGGAQQSDAGADVEFLVLNEQQFKDLRNGRAGEAVFSADAAHEQEVNASLPPTVDQPATYHLIFRNDAKAMKKSVEADFHIDF